MSFPTNLERLTVSANLRDRMLHFGLDSEELAEKAGVVPRTIYYWLSGAKPMTKHVQINKVMKVLGITRADLTTPLAPSFADKLRAFNQFRFFRFLGWNGKRKRLYTSMVALAEAYEEKLLSGGFGQTQADVDEAAAVMAINARTQGKSGRAKRFHTVAAAVGEATAEPSASDRRGRVNAIYLAHVKKIALARQVRRNSLEHRTLVRKMRTLDPDYFTRKPTLQDRMPRDFFVRSEEDWN